MENQAFKIFFLFKTVLKSTYKTILEKHKHLPRNLIITEMQFLCQLAQVSHAGSQK